MRAVVQRVSRAQVSVSGQVVGQISRGLCVLVGAGAGDSSRQVGALVDKVANLRIFPDSGGKMNLSVLDVGGAVLAVSQFTLFGDARKGRRPAFVRALEPVAAEQLYNEFILELQRAGISSVASGQFGADMLVSIDNDGPVTILIDTEKTF